MAQNSTSKEEVIVPSKIESDDDNQNIVSRTQTTLKSSIPFEIPNYPDLSNIHLHISAETDGSCISGLLNEAGNRSSHKGITQQQPGGRRPRIPINQSQNFQEAKNDLNRGNFSGALQKFNISISLGYQIFDSIRLKATAYLYENKFNSSSQCYQELIQKFPDREEGYYGKGLALSLMGIFDSVDSLFETAMKLNPQDWRCYFCKAYYKIKTKSYDSAFDLLTQCIIKNARSNYAISYIARAELFCYRRNFDAAHQDIIYAKKAVMQNDRIKALMQFQVENIQKNFEQYDKLIQRLKNAETVKQLPASKRQLYEAFLTKGLSRSAVMNNRPIFEQAVKRIVQLLENEGNQDALDSNLNPMKQVGEEPLCECSKCTIF